MNQLIFIIATYQANTAVNPNLVEDVVAYFASNPDPRKCKTDLAQIFAKWQHPKNKQLNIPQIGRRKEAVSPLATLIRPPSSPSMRKSLQQPKRSTPNSTTPVRREISTLENHEISQQRRRLVPPKVVVSKLKTSVRPHPQAPEKTLKSQARVSYAPTISSSPDLQFLEPSEAIAISSPIPKQLRGMPTIEPFIFREGLPIPSDIIERDILYVASQLVTRHQEDLPILIDKLTTYVMSVARNFKLMTFTKKIALRTIGQLFWRLDCAPIDFLNTFTYHPNNRFFEEIEFTEPVVNHAIRTSALYSRRLSPCEIDKSFGLRQQSTSQAAMEDFLSSFNGNLEDLAEGVEIVTHKNYKPKNLEKLLGGITIRGTEFGETTGSSLLAVPGAINETIRSRVLTSDERREYLKDGIIPRADIATQVILEEIKLLEDRLTKQAGEGRVHLDKSKIYKRGLRCVLQPTALLRQNFWQVRGSDLPSWFPGFYSVFQDSYKFRPTLQSSPSSTFLHAWRSLAPVIDSN